MNALALWVGMTGLRREMDRLVDRFFEPRWDAMEAMGEWAPRVDVSETKDALMVKAEVPGVGANDISVTLEDHMLTIKGEKREEKEAKDERYHRTERAYGEFTRMLRLPVAVDRERVTASFKNGLLTVMLPKAPPAKGAMIPVKEP